jgi:hypothetical protein
MAVKRFIPAPPLFALSKPAVLQPTAPHLAVHTAYGGQILNMLKPGDVANSTPLRSYVAGEHLYRVYVALRNTGAPASQGHLIVLCDGIFTIKCENEDCGAVPYSPKPESSLNGITIPFDLPDTRPKLITLTISHMPGDGAVGLRFSANAHEIPHDINLGHARAEIHDPLN